MYTTLYRVSLLSCHLAWQFYRTESFHPPAYDIPHGQGHNKRGTIYSINLSYSTAAQTRAMASSFIWFLDHTQRRTTVGRTPLDE